MSHNEPAWSNFKAEDYSPPDIKNIRDHDGVMEIRTVLGVIANNMAMPLYILFWISDLMYVPQFKWEFLSIRLLIIPLCLLIQALARRVSTFTEAQLVALLFNFGMAFAINYMIFRINAPATPYYAGLNLVAIGNLAFIPWTRGFYILVSSLIFGPYYIITLTQSKNLNDLKGIALNSFFIFSTILMLFFIRFFNEKLRRRELASRLALNKEIETRDETIRIKSTEAVKLAALSNQFSPQVVDAIRTGSIDLSTDVHRSQICAIFIDIVNSTERVLRVDKDKMHTAISMFMEDTIKTLLKYDITIDKFLGDGVLAFCNDPIRYKDYTDRVLRSAIEIREKINKKQNLYEDVWMNKFEIKIGIATGYCNVGFYGNQRYFKSYTAIGPVVNLASRLCGVAEPGQILISGDVLENKIQDDYETKFLGKQVLKGFEGYITKVYELNPALHSESNISDEIDCPSCKHGLMFLDNDANGIFILKCRACGYIQKEARTTSNITKKKIA